MMRASPLILLLALAGCANTPQAMCPAGQAEVRTAQLFLGSKAMPVSETDVRRFVDREVTPRFPDGVTIVDGGGQWTGDENRLIREASKVVLIVLPPKAEGRSRVEAVRRAYRTQFRQTPVVVAPPGACVAI
jgi:Protein of unknown function (DUF3574)